MAVLLVGRGNAHFGRTDVDAAGNIVKRTEAGWDPDPEGGSIAICELDPETMKQTEPAEVYGDWAASVFLRRVLEKLGPGRHINIPDMAAIIKGAIRDGFEPCEHCTAVGDCQDCVITEWKGEMNDEQN